MKKIFLIFAILCMCFTSCNTSGSGGIQETNERTTQTSSSNEEQTSNNHETQTSDKIEVNNIFLSKNEIILGIGETTTLIATISPSNAENTLTWSSSNNEVISVDNNGKVTAKSEGDAVIKVEADNGILAVCTATVKVKTGSVTGTVTYKYNSYVGNKADTGATVFLISKTVTSLPDSVGLGLTSSLPDGCFGTKVDGAGNYTIDNVPVGEYYLVIISKNTNEKMDNVAGFRTWGDVYFLFSSKGQESALNMAKLHKTRTTTISILENKTTTYSYDFGVTYI